MKLGVMGTGGVGGYFGGRLAAAGYDVTFIARGAHLAAIRREGLRVQSGLGDLHIHPGKATDSPAEIGVVDYVLFTTKLWDTETAGEAIRPLLGPQTAVVSLQNGVDAEQRLSAILGSSHVMGGLAQISAVIAAPGVIRHTGTMAKLVFGELDGRRSQRGAALLEAFGLAGVDAEFSDHIVRALWQKYVFLVGLSGATTVTRRGIGPVREDVDTRMMLIRLMSETLAVARAKGVELDDAYVKDRLSFIDTLPAEMTSSMHQDLERGNRLELEWLSGAVARMGQELGVETPINDCVFAALKLYARGRNREAPDESQPP